MHNIDLFKIITCPFAFSILGNPTYWRVYTEWVSAFPLRFRSPLCLHFCQTRKRLGVFSFCCLYTADSVIKGKYRAVCISSGNMPVQAGSLLSTVLNLRLPVILEHDWYDLPAVQSFLFYWWAGVGSNLKCRHAWSTVIRSLKSQTLCTHRLPFINSLKSPDSVFQHLFCRQPW